MVFEVMGPLGYRISDTEDDEEYPQHVFLHNIREEIKEYRSRSLQHFCRYIVARQDGNANHKLIEKDLKMWVVFEEYGTEVRKLCRPAVRRGKITHKVQVDDGYEWKFLGTILGREFPPGEAIVTYSKMSAWWDQNGKTFNWMGLPTELKTKIIQNCIGPPHWYAYLRRAPMRMRRNRFDRRPGPFEVTDQLDEWRGLLQASRQVRAIALRLCIVYNELSPGGLALYSPSAAHLHGAMSRLNSFPQLVKDNGIPLDWHSAISAINYLRYPKIHPDLDRYETAFQGIRQICLTFTFWDMMHFMKVDMVGFDRLRPDGFITCDVLDQLPHLRSISLMLPSDTHNVRNRGGIDIFDAERPCHRWLHRLICVHFAKVSAPYHEVFMNGFIQACPEEAAAFLRLRLEARVEYEETQERFADLYDDIEGGVALDGPVRPGPRQHGSSGVRRSKARNSSNAALALGSGSSIYDDDDGDGMLDEATRLEIGEVFPPICVCKVQCRRYFS